MEKTREELERGSLRVWVVDASRPVGAPEEGGFIEVVNKCDLQPTGGGAGGVRVSARTGEGLPALREELARRIQGGAPVSGEVVVTHRRHAGLLAEAATAFGRAAQNATAAPLEMVAYDLGEGARAIEQIVGRGVDDALLEAIFARFCIGK
jgi:tRNA modification GTPase